MGKIQDKICPSCNQTFRHYMVLELGSLADNPGQAYKQCPKCWYRFEDLGTYPSSELITKAING